MQMSPAPELGRYSNASEKYREFKKVIIQLKGSRWNLFLKIDHVFLLDITACNQIYLVRLTYGQLTQASFKK